MDSYCFIYLLSTQICIYFKQSNNCYYPDTMFYILGFFYIYYNNCLNWFNDFNLLTEFNDFFPFI